MDRDQMASPADLYLQCAKKTNKSVFIRIWINQILNHQT